MKKILFLSLLCILCSIYAFSQEQMKISILGDSYSTFQGYVQPDTNAVWYSATKRKDNNVDKVEQTWWHKFIKENNFQIEVNNSFSGSTICNTGYNKLDYSDRSFITRMDKLGNPDIIFIFGATNDSWTNAPIGEYKYTDWNKEELYTFRPAMAYMLDNMLQLYPSAKIYFILNSELKEGINESIHTICQHYRIACIDLHDIEKQAGHPSDAGMTAISEQLTTFIKSNQ